VTHIVGDGSVNDADGEPNPVLAAMTTTANTDSSPRKIRTLIVDDQLIQREVLRRLLHSETDFEIVGTPTNGREAVTSINELQPDLVLMDVQMPELDGFGVVSEIGAARMPLFIIITANDQFAQQASDAHALDYLLKPCTRARFQAALQRAREKIHDEPSSATA
jgi:two-component system LytT family response regulator